jgi:hypothetical protein
VRRVGKHLHFFTSGTPSPSVLAHPSAVAVVWLPGLNSRACRAVLTRGNAHIASTLASEIDGARVVPNADTYMCPLRRRHGRPSLFHVRPWNHAADRR